MSGFLTLDDLQVKNKIVLVRVDFNSPIDPKSKKIQNDTRIRAHGETTLKGLIQRGARIVILAHQGRPGEPDFTSLEQHSKILSKVLDKQVYFVDELYGEKAKKAIKELKNGEVLVLENTRMFAEEQIKKTPKEHSKSSFVRELTPLANIFVNDAFSTAHRAHASVVGFTPVLPSVAGRIMEKELNALRRVLEAPEKPCVFILGGAKADDSLKISEYVLKNNIANYVLTGGITGQLFLMASGIDLGGPNTEFLKRQKVLDFIPGIKELMSTYSGKVLVPEDVSIDIENKRKELLIKELPTVYPMKDIGRETIKKYNKIIKRSRTIVMSGPMGVYEKKEFMMGTKGILDAIATSKAFSLVGGGHTVAAVEKLKLTDNISYISTAGGALIEFLLGEKLPGVFALSQTTKKSD
jgi:phosphoglycerate kinase